MILADETLSFALFMTALSVIFVLSLFGIGWIVSRVMGRDDRITRCHLQSLSADLEVHETPEPGDVALIYRTFHGFQLWMVSVEHRYVLSPADARCLLGRLLQFNLTHGMHS